MRLRASAGRLCHDVGCLVDYWLHSRENDWLSSEASNRGVASDWPMVPMRSLVLTSTAGQHMQDLSFTMMCEARFQVVESDTLQFNHIII